MLRVTVSSYAVLRLATIASCTAIIHSIAIADRVITVPSAYTLQQGEGRLEYALTPSKSETAWLRFDAGVLPFLEIQVVHQPAASHKTIFLNAQYSLLQPFPEKAPGVSVGVLDVFNQTHLGRSPFIAVTWQFSTYADWATKENSSLTLGGGIGGLRQGAFVGVEVPIFKRTRFLGEYDRRTITAGLDIEAATGVAVRALFRDGVPILSIQIRRRL